jgi:NTP pyrophosphatase (non-canonical NTP hydrolase)
MDLSGFQDLIRRTYAGRDAARGIDGTFRWMVEEVGELASALRRGTDADRLHEVGDVLAWLASVATLAGVSLQDAAARYAGGCPVCGHIPCVCRGQERTEAGA